MRDKVAIVTGGASGTGKAMCLTFAREGARVATADIRETKAKQAAAEVAEHGKAISVHLDVTKSASADRMARDVHQQFGRIDILVNNVCVRIVKPFLEESGYITGVDIKVDGGWVSTKARAGELT